MTSSDDQRDEPPGDGPVEPHPSTDPPFDVDAAWRLIVDNYGERAQLGGGTADPALDPQQRPQTDPQTDHPQTDHPQDPLLRADTSATTRREPTPDTDRSRDRLDDRLGDYPEDDADDTGAHFVPPEPPPLPRGTPARRLAWIGLLAPPVLMLVAVVLGWVLPTWLSFLLVASFVGGFVFLVATMPRDGGDGWGDGAVV